MDIKARKKEFLKELYEYDIVLISKKSQERLWLHVESLLKEQEKEYQRKINKMQNKINQDLLSRRLYEVGI